MTHTEMSLDEKLELVKGMGSWHTNDLGGKIPSIHLSDGPHGLRAQGENAKSNNDSIVANCFPTACASACSFDRNLINIMAQAIATEAKTANVSVLLGPGVNMKRSPLCGRNFEYFSEDPYLAGELATAYVNGVQKQGVATSLKHFAANSQETHRMTSNSVIDERALREIYLRAFEKVVKNAKPATIMASYNLLNGNPACENSWLLTDVLRKEWGYKGLVMSDWGACVDAGACIEAGMDLEMPDSHGNHKEQILLALKEGKLREEALDTAVDRICQLVQDYKPVDKSGLKELPSEMLDENSILAEKISEESAVLLKNENVLPLNKPRKVIIVGDLAQKMRVQGGGSSHIHTRKLVNIIEAFKEEGIQTIFYRGYDSEAKDIGEVTSSDKILAEAAINGIKKELDAKSDIPILVFGGLTDNAEGEGYDRVTLSLPTNQRNLYRQLQDVTENIIYVSFGGAPYDMSDIIYAKAILGMYLGGESVARAAVRLLLGKGNPSGRLAETWPMALQDTPCYNNFGRQNNTADDVPYTGSIYTGYRYYDSFEVPVRFPFGYGLSYTGFIYSNMDVTRNGEKVTVSVDITNIGGVKGKEAVLVFVKNSSCELIRANRELRGFDKVELEPGETKRVSIDLDDRAFEVYDVSTGAYITIPGKYDIEISKYIGNVILFKPIEIEKENALNGLHNCKYNIKELPSYQRDLAATANRFTRDDFEKIYGGSISDFTNVGPGHFTAKNSLSQMAPYSSKARFWLRFGKIATRVMTGKSINDPEARMMYEGISEGNIDSVCNQSGGIVSAKTIQNIIAQANKEGSR